VCASSNSLADVRIREASFADYCQIAAVETRNGLTAKSAAEWEHIWVNNPAFQSLDGNWPIGWVLEDQDGRVVGSFGNIPLLFELKGRRLLGTSGRAWAVDLRYRGYSILLLDYFLNQKLALFFNTTANREASAAFSAFQAVRVPVGKWDESIFWITEHRGFVESLFRVKSAPLAALAAYPASKIWSLFDTVRGQGFRREQSSLDFAFCSDFDGRFDVFWRELQNATPRLLSLRTSEVLKWHFRYAIDRKDLLILTAEDRRGLQAYAIFGRQDNSKIGLRRVVLFDFQCIAAAGAKIFLVMLKDALRRCVEDGVHMLEVTGLRPDYAAAAERLSPHRRKLSSWRYLYKTNDEELARVLRDPALWDPTCYDGDASI
jgi:hypothetical protein